MDSMPWDPQAGFYQGKTCRYNVDQIDEIIKGIEGTPAATNLRACVASLKDAMSAAQAALDQITSREAESQPGLLVEPLQDIASAVVATEALVLPKLGPAPIIGRMCEPVPPVQELSPTEMDEIRRLVKDIRDAVVSLTDIVWKAPGT
jgi:hypothetical protein